MLSATFMFGNRAYDWKTMPTFRRFGGRWVMSVPSTLIEPWVGCSKPAIIRSVVVFPQPDGPRKETNSPFSALRLKSSTAIDGPKRFWTPSRTRKLIGWSPSASVAAANLEAAAPALARPTQQGDDAHGGPRQAEADQ